MSRKLTLISKTESEPYDYGKGSYNFWCFILTDQKILNIDIWLHLYWISNIGLVHTNNLLLSIR